MAYPGFFRRSNRYKQHGLTIKATAGTLKLAQPLLHVGHTSLSHKKHAIASLQKPVIVICGVWARLILAVYPVSF